MSSSASEQTVFVRRRTSRYFTAAFAALWLCAAGAGLWVLWAYENRPGTPATVGARWPAGASFARASDRPTLVMLAHPRCVCTRASLTELAEVLARAETKPRAYVLFLRPQAFAEGWQHTDLWRQASALPETTVIKDDGGVEARRFGAETSGQTMLYGTDGTLLFSGGITGARGHAGENAGRAALLSKLRPASMAERAVTRVFGCSLFRREKDGYSDQ